MLLIKAALLAILIILFSLCFVMIVTTVWCYFGNVVMYLFTRDKSYIEYLKWKNETERRQRAESLLREEK